MRLNILRITLEFKYPTFYDYQQLKKFMNLVSRPNLKIIMEDINYNEKTTKMIQNDLDVLEYNVVTYNNINKIIKELDNKIEENEKLMYKKI